MLVFMEVGKHSTWQQSFDCSKLLLRFLAGWEKKRTFIDLSLELGQTQIEQSGFSIWNIMGMPEHIHLNMYCWGRLELGHLNMAVRDTQNTYIWTHLVREDSEHIHLNMAVWQDSKNIHLNMCFKGRLRTPTSERKTWVNLFFWTA